MIGESLAIIAVILVLAAMLAKSGRHIFAAFTLPLVSVPIFYLIGSFTGSYLQHNILNIIGFLLGAGLCVLSSRLFRSRRSRTAYLLFCILFMAALLLAYSLYLN